MSWSFLGLQAEIEDLQHLFNPPSLANTFPFSSHSIRTNQNVHGPTLNAF